MSNPYRGLPDSAFWLRAVSPTALGRLDPVIGTVQISASEKIGTLGSCFAQHIANRLQRQGFNYFVAEAAPPRPISRRGASAELRRVLGSIRQCLYRAAGGATF